MHTHGLKDHVLGQLELPATTLYAVYLQTWNSVLTMIDEVAVSY